MSYDEDPVEEILAYLRALGSAALHGGRQMAVESITTVLKLVDREMDLLVKCRNGLWRARETSKIANVEQLEGILKAVKVIVETLRGK